MGTTSHPKLNSVGDSSKLVEALKNSHIPGSCRRDFYLRMECAKAAQLLLEDVDLGRPPGFGIIPERSARLRRMVGDHI